MCSEVIFKVRLMKYLGCILFLLGCLQVIGQNNEDWVTLFNGENLKGWKKLNGTAEYRVENGMIIGTSKMHTPNTFLTTQKRYSDFILEYEMKMERTLNSGVQIRSNTIPSYKNGQVHGYQVECDDSKRRYTAGIYDEGRRGWIYKVKNETSKAAYKNGEWNKFRVEAIGDEIRTWLNGVPVSNLRCELTKEGFIGLQVHSIHEKEKENKTICWRNIRILTKNFKNARWEMPDSIVEKSYLFNRLTKTEKQQGWQLLWNGKSFKGWKSVDGKSIDENSWKINGRTFTAQGKSAIRYKKGAGKYIFDFEFQVGENAEGGIKYLFDKQNNDTFVYQVFDDGKELTDTEKAKGKNLLAALRGKMPANGQVYGGKRVKLYKRNRWNKGRIIVTDTTVEQYIANAKVVDFNYAEKGIKPSSVFIEIENLKGEINYRNLKIKALKK
ncbi:DUF1080 domain-containing protein [Prolixibacteraceae bacterium JC049]|nr:DUF1080 domain-containing protein [Prolixibacteraceae bacterium JC049]